MPNGKVKERLNTAQAQKKIHIILSSPREHQSVVTGGTFKKDASNQMIFAVLNRLSFPQHGAVIYELNSPFTGLRTEKWQCHSQHISN